MLSKPTLLTLPREILIPILMYTGHPQYLARLRRTHPILRENLREIDTDYLMMAYWKFLYERDYQKTNMQFPPNTSYQKLYEKALVADREIPGYDYYQIRLFEWIRSGDLESIQKYKWNIHNFLHLFKNGYNPIQLARSKENWNIVNYFYQQAVQNIFNSEENEASIFGDTKFDWAAACGQLSVFLNPLGELSTKIKDYEVPFLNAIEHNNLNIVSVLINKIDVNSVRTMEGETAIYIAAFYGYLEILQFLIESGARLEELNDNGKTALHGAAYNGQTKIVEFLIKKRMAIDTSDNHNKTPCYLAAKKGHLEVFKALKNAGAELNIKDDRERTMLFAACESGHIEIVNILIDARVPLNDFDDSFRPPILIALMRGHCDIALALIEAGADVNVDDNCDENPLTIAIKKGYDHLVQRMLEAGADLNIDEAAEVELANPKLYNLICLWQINRMYADKPILQKIQTIIDSPFATENTSPVPEKNFLISELENLYKDLKKLSNESTKQEIIMVLKKYFYVIPSHKYDFIFKYIFDKSDEINTVVSVSSELPDHYELFDLSKPGSPASSSFFKSFYKGLDEIEGSDEPLAKRQKIGH